MVVAPLKAVIIPSLNSPIIDQVLAALEEQEGIDQVDEILVVGKDDYGYISTGRRAHLLDTKIPVLPGSLLRRCSLEKMTYLSAEYVPAALQMLGE